MFSEPRFQNIETQDEDGEGMDQNQQNQVVTLVFLSKIVLNVK